LTSSRYLFLGIALALAAGCGNYSNEDLEFMNAMPSQRELATDIPARSALTQGMEAELAKATHDVSKSFNGMLFSILGGVDLIRSFPPSDRGPNSRTWGPVPQDRVPGWRWHFVVTRDSVDPTTFFYALELQRNTDPPNVWVPFLDGQFTSTRGARRGVGSFTMQTDDLRTANYPNDAEGRKIRSLTVEYDTRAFPISVHATLETFPNPDDTTVMVTTKFDYGVTAEGQGAMRFQIMGNLDVTSAAVETMTVTSRWLPSGEGRAEATITLGDGVGLTEIQCWNRDFNPTYTNKPWPVSADSPDPSPHGMESDCPEFPEL
jgi:hypothetical protein